MPIRLAMHMSRPCLAQSVSLQSTVGTGITSRIKKRHRPDMDSPVIPQMPDFIGFVSGLDFEIFGQIRPPLKINEPPVWAAHTFSIVI